MNLDPNTNSNVRLSICMPTYNFGAYIGATLDSIVPQLADDVEVVILDGGSTDNTSDVVGSFVKRYPNIRYHYLNKRGGIDRDLARTVALARGEYVWLFCSDDIMMPAAILDITRNISSRHDLYVCGFTLCTRDMHRLMEQPILKPAQTSEFELSEECDRLAYFARADTTTAFFSFAGSLVMKRAKWNSVPLNETFAGSCWAHVARIFELIPNGLRVKYLPAAYLRKRMENDSFMDRGLVHRYSISVDGYHELARTFFGENSEEAFAIRRVVRNEYPPQVMLHAKFASEGKGHPGVRSTLDRLAQEAYRDPGFRNRAYYMIYRWTPRFGYRFVQAVYRGLGLSPWSRAAVRASHSEGKWRRAIN